MAPAAECTLLPGVEGIFIQLVLFGICCGVLATKYHFEGAGRPLKDFLLDSSKQLIGAGFVHVLNMVCSVVLSHDDKPKGGSECGWYFLNIVVDCTLGVGVEYLALGVLVSVLSTCDDSVTTGDYRGSDRCFVWQRYWKQLGLWLLAVSSMKFVVLSGFWLCWAYLDAAVDDVLGMLKPEAQLPFVMIVTPLFMNALQFVLTDGFLKKRTHAHRARGGVGVERATSVACAYSWLAPAA
jgi:hypothetical protein